jgi:carboxypeptidase Taq
MTSTDKFYSSIKKIHHLEGIKALLDWDSQVYMPVDGATVKGDQIELVSVLLHQEVTDPKLQNESQTILDSVTDTSHPDYINAKALLKTITREKKLSADFVAKRSKLHTETFHLWQKAKKENNYNLVKNNLAKVFETAREEAQLVGYQEHLYDALLDQYEPGGRVSWVRPLLEELGESLSVIIKDFAQKKNQVQSCDLSLSLTDQHALGCIIMEAFGLPKSASRLDVSSHPFCTTIGSGDVRITTRFKEEDFLYGLGSILHELGHALYEYNLPNEFRGTACGSVFSLGMHESQSRLIENCIGRSKSFAEFLSTTLKNRFKKQVSSDSIYQRQNTVTPSLIRVDADEVSYSLHIVIRMLLEIDLLSGSVSFEDLPEAWNNAYEKYLGIKPKNYSEGLLQDVHWYSGAIGYFPTYALGNIFDGVILSQMKKDFPSFDQQVQVGDFLPLTKWLKEKIHSKASRQESRQQIAELQSSETLSADLFLNYLREKL